MPVRTAGAPIAGTVQLGCLQRHEQLGGDRPRMAGSESAK